MSSRRLALLGAPAGPWVYTAGIHNPRVKVRGLQDAILTVRQRTSQTDERELTFHLDGLYDVPAVPWMRVSCHPHTSSVCAEILSGASDAISGS